MKKNNSYLTDGEIDLRDLIKLLWREKILILFISIICGLLGYFYGLSKPQQFKSEITLRNPPVQIFELYNFFNNFNNNNNNNNSNNNNNNNIAGQFISDFKLNFLSSDNLQSFLEESREFDNFKGYLKSRNISAKKYFANKISEAKEKNLIIPNKYFLVFTKELEGDIFLNNYTQFIKKKTILDLKKNIKLSIENKIYIHELALEKAKLINLINPIQRSINEYVLVSKTEDLFYKGSIILSQEIIYFKKFLIQLENDQFNFEFISDKPLNSSVKKMSNFGYFAIGLMLGLFLSLGIIFFMAILNKFNKKTHSAN
jgi:LPS O-antigen subunit length determinant protein (WzzB/FepE family)